MMLIKTFKTSCHVLWAQADCEAVFTFTVICTSYFHLDKIISQSGMRADISKPCHQI